MMSSSPYFLFYPADYLADTQHLTTEEHGAYLLLLMNYWQTGKPLNNSNGRLTVVARVLPERWESVATVLSEFFDIEGGTWTHGRMDYDLAAVKAKSVQASYAGRASAAKRKSNGKATVVPTVVEIPFNGEPTINKGMNEGMKEEKKVYETSYQKFLDIYPRIVDPNGSTKRAFVKALKKTDPKIILDGALSYKNDPNRDPAFTAMSATWLNQERWLIAALPGTSKPKGQTFLENFRQERSTPERLALN